MGVPSAPAWEPLLESSGSGVIASLKPSRTPGKQIRLPGITCANLARRALQSLAFNPRDSSIGVGEGRCAQHVEEAQRIVTT